MKQIIGRSKEKKVLQQLLENNEASFLALYGRKGLGKTHLIKNFFKDKGPFFHLTGMQDASLDVQLKNFSTQFSECFEKGKPIQQPVDWFEALQLLRKEVAKLSKETKVILFFDELPWLATPKSLFMQALEHLWNRYLSGMRNVILIVCGSNASWMINQVVNNTGGLYGRLTKAIRLLPFSLLETEEFLHAKNIHLDRKQIIEIYMCLGGVAKYLTQLERGKSSSQMIGELCFTYNAPLISEFHKVYQSLFLHYQEHITIVKALAKKRSGLTYKEIAQEIGAPSGGTLSSRLEELVESGFIMQVPFFGKGERSYRYVLIDEYSLFYLSWMSGTSSIDIQTKGADYWLKQKNTQSWKTWAGFSFETICLKHTAEIKAALGLAAVQTSSSKWQNNTPEESTQIDLIIDRKDQCINLCEIKFYADRFSIDKDYAATLRKKQAIFTSVTGTKKATFLTLITTYGTQHNEHFFSSVDQELDMNALFTPV